MAQQQIVKDERSVGELFSELANETTTLIKQEIALAQAELTQKATKIGKNVGYLAAGGAVAYLALQAVIVAIIVGLAYFIPLWLSALIVGVVIGIVAAILISSALKNLKNVNPMPEKTVETLKEDAKWLKEQI